MPSQYTPKPKTKVIQCWDCGRDMTVGWKTRTAKRCGYCIDKAVGDAIRQMHAKSGPYYDKWLVSMRKAVRDETPATPGGG